MGETIGLLHPGEMGAAIGGVLVGAGHRVLWDPNGRSAATAARADRFGLAAASLGELLEASSLVISVCPPHAAEEVARSVAGFTGVYLDANAIAPATARRVAAIVEEGGGRYVDGGILGGPPPRRSDPTRLCLSGEGAKEVAELFAGTPVMTVVLDAGPGAASATKMAFAALTKGSAALLLGVRALARAEGVEAPLLDAWSASNPDAERQSLQAAGSALTKGWRWTGEMDEIAASFRDAGLPGGFHEAASEVFARAPRDEQGAADEEGLARVIAALLRASDA